MVATVFYLDSLPAVGELATVEGDEGFHAATVRRIRPGEHVTLSDGVGGLAECEVEQADRSGLRARVLGRRDMPPVHPPVTVVQALPKSDRSELAIELSTEAGADSFVPWQAARCIANWEGARAEKGLRRWRAVARSAARQSRRPYIPDVEELASTSALTRRIQAASAAGAVVLVLHESATLPVRDVPLTTASSILLVVGPEGGITPDEIDGFLEAGATAVRLGPTVLRTSTAAAVALGALGVLTARWAPPAE